MTEVKNGGGWDFLKEIRGYDSEDRYLISFRISNHPQKRYNAIYNCLTSLINTSSADVYHHTTSTYIIKPNRDIFDIVKDIHGCIDEKFDHVIVIPVHDSVGLFLGDKADFSDLQKNYMPKIQHKKKP